MSEYVLTEKRGSDAGPEMIGGEFRRQRANFINLISKLDPADWNAKSRCPDWSVHDLVGHVINIAELHVISLSGGPGIERFMRHTPFDPNRTPARWLADSPQLSPEATIEKLRSLVEEEREQFAKHPGVPEDGMMVAPTGRQVHWSTRSLHSLWDAWIHERDVALALGVEPESKPEDFPMITMYGLLIAAGVAAGTGNPQSVTLELRNGGESRYEIGIDDGDVYVVMGTDSGPQGHGSTIEVMESLTGRGAGLAQALRAPEPVVNAMSLLGLIMSGAVAMPPGAAGAGPPSAG
ncbi:maleylpyruvate isomerase family mycothiol-dependent enzyme [Micromonospora sp. NBC_01699]|uniref:maleylpyruvate isomerase family mycothiol-dependent enzyme n=1 Tax=Micromonospora sp. NBC_01699 TaxID=2975984 RepID=UPI002E381E24|nr:maleylpyruvate isomerase family mycothiol-dependent enzyme [Micromonospora sp. NBC_01699]